MSSIRIATSIMALFLASCASSIPSKPTSSWRDELYQVEPPEAILKSARKLVEADGYGTLVTVDGQGQPRARSVGVVWNDAEKSDPRKALNLWVMTRGSTRKIEQIQNNPRVTLYFNDDSNFSYLSIMGTAILHTDPSSPEVKPVLIEKWKDYFWPDFPKGFVMIEIKPQWIEFMGPGVPNNKVTWRPQAVELRPQ